MTPLHSAPAGRSGSARLGPAVPWREPGMLRIGLGLALIGAALLILRAYLPRWLFDAAAPNWIWPVTVFVSYVSLGIAAMATMSVADHWLARRDLPLLKRMLIGSGLILKVNGLLVFLVIAPLVTRILHAKLFFSGMWILSSTLGIALYVCLLLNRVSAAQRAQVLQAQLESDQLEIALSRAELSMIEAQIEPHFLFNTLAHVKRQYRIDVDAAEHMLAGLIEYLERAAPALQRTDWTLGNELDLIHLYLDILKHRFGERLRFSIAATEQHRAIRLPALSVTTLVENAVRHGISPKAEGGLVAVTVESLDGGFLIQVCDDGVGLRQSSGTGLGLATVRACLRSRFGEQASLLVEPREPSGVRAAIRIPGQVQ